MAISTINQAGLNAPLTLTSPVLTTPNLGTPSAINLSNATALPTSALPAGSIVQIVSTTKVDTFSSSGTTYIDVTGLSVSITPQFSTSKLMISVNGSGAAAGIGGLRVTDGSGTIIAPYGTPYQSNFYPAHGMLAYFNGDANQFTNVAFQFMETNAVGTTSAVTRKIQARGEGSGTAFSINRGTAPSNGSYASPVTTITVMEIKQ
jgi:hypothetical protein